MPRLLVVSYAYPPLGGIAIIRALTLAREAKKKGWEVAFLAVANDPLYLRDPSISTEAKPVWAYRYPIFTITNRFLRRLLPGKQFLWTQLDAFFDWVPDAVRVGKQLYKMWPYDAIFASAPRYSSLRVAAKLKKALGVPTIGDLRDSLLANFTFDYIHPWYRRLLQIYYNRLLSRFDKVTAVDLNAVKGVDQPYEIIWNGYDEEEFQGEVKRYDEFTISYVGTMYDQYDLQPFYNAVKRLQKSSPIPIRYLFVGSGCERVAKMAKKLKLDNFEVKGHVPRSEAIEVMRKSHALLSFAGDATDALGAKIFECARAGCTVLNLSRRHNIPWRFVEESGLAINVDSRSADSIEGAILQATTRTDYAPPNGIDQYSRQRSAERILQILDSLVQS